MTHDPLCHLSRETGEFNLMADRCYYCKLIAKVRADEREKAARRVTEFFWPHGGSWMSANTTFDRLGRGAVNAVRGKS